MVSCHGCNLVGGATNENVVAVLPDNVTIGDSVVSLPISVLNSAWTPIDGVIGSISNYDKELRCRVVKSLDNVVVNGFYTIPRSWLTVN